MALTRIQIISNAVSLLGKGIVTTLANPSPLVAAADQAFDFLLPSIISQSRWRFASKIAPLALSSTPPLGSYWKYFYYIPHDYLELLRIFPQTWDYEIFSEGLIAGNFLGQAQAYVISYAYPTPANMLEVAPFNNVNAFQNSQPEVYGCTFTTSGTLPTTTPQINNVDTYYITPVDIDSFTIHTNFSDASNNANEIVITNIGTGQSNALIQNSNFIEYTFLPDVSVFPPYFSEFFAYKIAAYLALSSAQSAEYFQILDSKATDLWMKAKSIDAKNRPQSSLQSQPIIANRFVSQFASG